MMSTLKAIPSDGKYWHHSNWSHAVVACLEMCESLIRKKERASLKMHYVTWKALNVIQVSDDELIKHILLLLRQRIFMF